jgi:D-xylose transport system substrate-binding protein
MRRGIIALAAAGLLAVTGLTACGGDDGDSGGTSSKKPKIGVILPDSKSSARWETADRKYLEEAFKAAGVDYDIQNAQNDKNAFQTIADQMLTSGVTALMIVNLDSGTGKAVWTRPRTRAFPPSTTTG